MKLFKKHVYYFIIAIILFELFFILGLLVSDSIGFIQNTDRSVLGAVVDMRNGEPSGFVKWISTLGDYEFVLHATIIIALLTAVFGHMEVSLGVVSGIAIVHYLTSAAKQFFHVLRPDDFIIVVSGWSYPSGHTSGATVLAIMAIWAAYATIPRKYQRTQMTIVCVAVVYAVSVALSRVYLGVHWLSDIVGGMILAAAVGTFVIGVLKPIIIKRQMHTIR